MQFPKGEIGTTIKGSIKGRETVDYKLRARAGQGMIVGLETDNSSNYFNVMAPGESNAAFFIGSNEGNRFEGDLPESGDYTIRVYLYRNAARRGESARYSLEVAIAAAGEVPSEADGGHRP
ncbi:MAG: DNA breaking-rejoining protein [Pseudomonadota bacterium]|nr:DNA breaking-rejoining protein [Pseudomonadota bacterium]